MLFEAIAEDNKHNTVRKNRFGMLKNSFATV
jgi:hypothetical protein